MVNAQDYLFSSQAQWVVTGLILLANTKFLFTCSGKQILPFVAFVTGKLGKVNLFELIVLIKEVKSMKSAKSFCFI